MSAQPHAVLPSPDKADHVGTERSARPLLRAVPRPGVHQIGRIPFIAMLVSILVVGMVGLLLLNTSLQSQAFEANKLKRAAVEASYVEGELEQRVIEAASTQELTRRATQLGLRPDARVAYVNLQEGLVSGDTKAGRGGFLDSALTRSPEQIERAKEQKAARQAGERLKKEQAAGERVRARVQAEIDKEQAAEKKAAEGTDTESDAGKSKTTQKPTKTEGSR